VKSSKLARGKRRKSSDWQLINVTLGGENRRFSRVLTGCGVAKPLASVNRVRHRKFDDFGTRSRSLTDLHRLEFLVCISPHVIVVEHHRGDFHNRMVPNTQEHSRRKLNLCLAPMDTQTNLARDRRTRQISSEQKSRAE
jgi:hypothetical protein